MFRLERSVPTCSIEWSTLFHFSRKMFQLSRWSVGPEIADGRSVVRLALALFGAELSPRFCFARVAAIVEWDGVFAHHLEQVQLGRSPYPARLEILAEHSVTWLLCGSFPRERLGDAARCAISVRCGVSGGVPDTDDALTTFIIELGLLPEVVTDQGNAVASSSSAVGSS